MDIPDTTVAVLAEARGVTMVFKVADPSDATALDAVRLRVRALADHYRREPVVFRESKDLQRTASRDEGMSPSLTAQNDATRGAAVRTDTRRVDAETGQTIGASGQYSVVVKDTSDGSKITISSNNSAELDLLRARMTQDAQVMMQAGSCPW